VTGLSLFPASSVARLSGVPWRSLAGLAPSLDIPLSAVLGGTAAERVLARYLRGRPSLSPPERRAVAEAVFGVGLWRRRLAHHTGSGAGPRALLATLLRDLAGVREAEAICELPAGSLPREVPAPADLALFFSLPDWLADTLRREAGDEAPSLADALNCPGPIFLRANRGRTGREALAERLREEGVGTRPGRLAPDALEVISQRPNVLALPSFRAGLFEVQDEGSQVVGEAVAPVPGDEVLDLCAGAGGKALLIAGALGGRGTVHACDSDGERLERLARRAAKAGARLRVHGASPPRGLSFDRVLVDAPCSALGPLRRGPDLRFRIDPASFAALPSLQLELVSRGAALVRPGGRLVYATCTMRREENEEVAAAFEGAHPEYERVPPVGASGLVDRQGFLSLAPHRHGTDGFFAAAWQRRSSKK
jgi:16S rRNA (cytosine967-C5)-methyltransferase